MGYMEIIFLRLKLTEEIPSRLPALVQVSLFDAQRVVLSVCLSARASEPMLLHPSEAVLEAGPSLALPLGQQGLSQQSHAQIGLV